MVLAFGKGDSGKAEAKIYSLSLMYLKLFLINKMKGIIKIF